MQNTLGNNIVRGLAKDSPITLEQLPSASKIFQKAAKCGVNGKLVHAPKYRNSIATKKLKLAMDFDALKGLVSKQLGVETVRLVYDQTLIYEPGMFFAKHTDSQASSALPGQFHLGTLVILPPMNLVSYDGGELVIDQLSFSAFPDTWSSVFIPLGTAHSVEAIKSGTRIVWKFYVFSSQPLPKALPSSAIEDSSESTEDDVCDGSCRDGLFSGDDGW